MLFLLQKEERYKDLDFEIMFLKDKLDHNKYVHEYRYDTIESFDENVMWPKIINIKEAVPVGSIDFVGKYLKTIHGIENMNPIEIPECLRTGEFLKRKYSIIHANEIPQAGEYFLKDVSQLKKFHYSGELSYIFHDKICDLGNNEQSDIHLDKSHLYQLSEKIDILSEYRVYFINGELQTISHYNGDPWLMPELNLIKKANLIYSIQKDYPKSYTMDVAITPAGTCLLEIHPFACIGLYSSLWGDNLMWAYRDGIDYYINHNTLIYKEKD